MRPRPGFASLTGARAHKTQDAVRVGISADQLWRDTSVRRTRFPSLELGCESARSGNAFGYSGTYKTQHRGARQHRPPLMR